MRGDKLFLFIGIGFLILASWAMLNNTSIKTSSSGNVKVDNHQTSWEIENKLSIEKPPAWPNKAEIDIRPADY